MELKKHTFLIVLLVALVVLLLCAAYISSMSALVSPSSRIELTIASTTVLAEVVSTEVAREQGLSGRSSLAEGNAMLFVFDSADLWGIWMKDMQFSIDILWADAEGTIVSIEENVSPSTYPTAFRPQSPSLYVVELPAGFVATHSISLGSKIVVQ